MYVLGYFLQALAVVLDYVLLVYGIIIVARAIISWVNPDPYNPIVRFLYNVTEPVLFRIRAKLPTSFSGIDFTPILVILTIMFLRIFLVKSLLALASKLL